MWTVFKHSHHVGDLAYWASSSKDCELENCQTLIIITELTASLPQPQTTVTETFVCELFADAGLVVRLLWTLKDGRLEIKKKTLIPDLPELETFLFQSKLASPNAPGLHQYFWPVEFWLQLELLG